MIVKIKLLRDLLVIGVAVLILDWILGAMCASGGMPRWVFLLFNIPFGAMYVWMESSWVGTHYEVLGYTFGDDVSLVVFLFVIAAQSHFYFALYEWWRRKRCGKVAVRRGESLE
jgi:uncharacterized membrane protein YphA (DoxX/SURF4 family)